MPARVRQPDTLLCHQMANPEALLSVAPDGLSIHPSGWELRSFGVRDFPSAWAQWGMQELIGDFFRDALRIPCPFLFSFAIHAPCQERQAQRAALYDLLVRAKRVLYGEITKKTWLSI